MAIRVLPTPPALARQRQLNKLFGLSREAGARDARRELEHEALVALHGEQLLAAELGCPEETVADSVAMGLECGRQGVKCVLLDLAHAFTLVGS